MMREMMKMPCLEVLLIMIKCVKLKTDLANKNGNLGSMKLWVVCNQMMMTLTKKKESMMRMKMMMRT